MEILRWFAKKENFLAEFSKCIFISSSVANDKRQRGNEKVRRKRKKRMINIQASISKTKD